MIAFDVDRMCGFTRLGRLSEFAIRRQRAGQRDHFEQFALGVPIGIGQGQQQGMRIGRARADRGAAGDILDRLRIEAQRGGETKYVVHALPGALRRRSIKQIRLVQARATMGQRAHGRQCHLLAPQHRNAAAGCTEIV
ncbi:MAG: hypothetical protein KDI72_09670, partial [Xanthomonadales bacterium]|nr:hypothetical protein [Xanthomonadales bacterium]